VLGTLHPPPTHLSTPVSASKKKNLLAPVSKNDNVKGNAKSVGTSRPVRQSANTARISKLRLLKMFMMGALAVDDARNGEEEEAMKRRLRERQMPRRRFSVGPAQRRHRVAYDDGMYRWE
jgi:hypothetical protein